MVTCKMFEIKQMNKAKHKQEKWTCVTNVMGWFMMM